MRGVLRSGCYVTHDHGSYKRYMAAMDTRLSCGHGLHAALEVWALVQSCPEPGLALLTAGKRDLSYDIEMPIPAMLVPARRIGAASSAGRMEGERDERPACLPALACGAADAPQVGDLVGLGISHPCTTFDKWRWMAVVNDDYDVVDAIVTYF